MSLLQHSIRTNRPIGLFEGQRPLVMRTNSDEDDLSSIDGVSSSTPPPTPAADTTLSRSATLPKSIDWSLTYSSDEESQKRKKQRSRSLSEPAMDITNAMRRRPRSPTFDYRSASPSEAAVAEDVSSLPYYRSQRFTPMMCLAILFAISCYTTFWLPYPDIRPVSLEDPLLNQRASFDGNTAAAALRPPTSLRMVPPGAAKGISPDGWMHARAEHAREPLIYRMEEDPLLKYYQQEAFQTRSYTKEANIAMLVLISLWAVWEHRRRTSASATV